MTKRRNVLNQIPPINEVKNPIKPYEDKEKRIVFDISFKGLFYFVDCKGFTNRLRNEKDFSEKFSRFIKLIHELEKKEFRQELILNPGMRHCHQINQKEKRELVHKCFVESLKECVSQSDQREDYWAQITEGEKLYQIGFEREWRFIGIYKENRNLFYILLFDWHHSLFPDDRRNTINPKQMKYSLFGGNKE